MPMQIGTARAWGRLRDAFDLKGKHSLLLDEVVVPIVLVEDLTRDDPLADDRQAQGGTVLGALPANVNQHQLFNPADSDVLLELYLVTMCSGGTIAYDMGPTAAALATDAGGQWQDRRLPAASFPVGRMQSTQVAAATLVLPAVFRTLTTVINTHERKVSLPPGTGYMVESSVVNILTAVSFFWSERDLLPGE